ncbi:50S ribosomal protein L4 [Candidatus Clavichlamydia salmonicola]|uniref:50S ribosomal protein L4 n=1 Tax=Candidatus Clavichlamydia salmonicola TaxID=469812 RepID=UPI001890F919|nr:50S ribosomal protein L4 [Candidatus Clavichlamydia salmonicola]MBF5050748.1 50S ribosomal protein L4 [Candidatus Clavichlamydia salmonicola]
MSFLLSKYNFEGRQVGELSVDEDFLNTQVSSQAAKDYLVALRKNKRQWSASVKGRSEVSHSTRKPFRQKGTGNARQGTLAAPHYRGGGIVFGPLPKFNQHVRINKKERRAVIRLLFAEKIKSNAVCLVEDNVFTSTFDVPKTSQALSFLNLLPIQKRQMIFVSSSSLAGDFCFNFRKSVRNLTGFRDFLLGVNLNGYDLAVARSLIIAESAFVEMIDLLTHKTKGE